MVVAGVGGPADLFLFYLLQVAGAVVYLRPHNRKDREMIDDADIPRLAVHVSRCCEWDGEDICAVFLEALTDANFHTLRGQLEEHIKEYFKKGYRND